MAFADSVQKIILTYFTAVTEEPFAYRGECYRPQPLTLSPLLFRGFVCLPNCGGCCPAHSLDWLPSEIHPTIASSSTVKPRMVDFNLKKIQVYSDLQADRHEAGEHFCRNLSRPEGLCNIHGRHPLSCDFEILRFLHYQDQHNSLSNRLFGRGWAFKRVDGERGALCYMTPVDSVNIPEIIRKLGRLQAWASHFGLARTKIPSIIEWVKAGPHVKPTIV